MTSGNRRFLEGKYVYFVCVKSGQRINIQCSLKKDLPKQEKPAEVSEDGDGNVTFEN